ncbi:SDR family oxidoreductase [Botrimarina sp.]|uniref:SDR family oxidoreductase n=1 Tax=Botrimarina sp. TaxID=2795802 RepID=UPI0032ED69CE
MTWQLVTGGAGFVGSHLAQALLRRGDRVRVFDNLSTGRQENLDLLRNDAEIITAELGDLGALESAMRGVEVVYHQAALPSVPRSLAAPLETHAACVTGTLNVLEAARRAGVRRVVYAASSSAYGDQPHMSKRETDLPRPLSPYAAAKLAGEYYCQAYANCFDLEAVAIRYFNVFGPRQDPDSAYAAVIPRFIVSMLEGRRPLVHGDGLQSRDFTYIDNVVTANLSAAVAGGVSGRTINVACGKQTTLLEILGHLGRILARDARPEFGPRRPGDPRESLADISAARALLGYDVEVDLETGLERTVDYYASRGERLRLSA